MDRRDVTAPETVGWSELLSVRGLLLWNLFLSDPVSNKHEARRGPPAVSLRQFGGLRLLPLLRDIAVEHRLVHGVLRVDPQQAADECPGHFPLDALRVLLGRGLLGVLHRDG